MKKTLIAAVLALCCTALSAESWTGPDKTKHLAVGALTGLAVTVVTNNEWYGAGTGCGIGLAKEIYDSRHKDKYTASFQDFAVTCIGAVAASGGTKFYLNRQNGVTQIIFNIPIK